MQKVTGQEHPRVLPAEALGGVVTRRGRSLFEGDMLARRAELEAGVAGRRVLVIGGAGSIGSATIRELAPLRPAALHVVDQNENGLAELVRNLRSRPEPLDIPDLRTLPLDFGSAIMERFIAGEPRYDLVLNFAAIKHVRSEKDLPSLLQMLDTNVVKAARLLGWLARRGGADRYFCVSTDKAANPVNLMGATKRLMEHVTFGGGALHGFEGTATSARFANVAFSNGSLLESFLRRLALGQPLAVPRDTRRFFVSLEEAGQICSLAAVCAPDRHLLIPRLNAAEDLQLLDDVAGRVLAAHDLRPAWYDDEAAARAAVAAELSAGRYPVLLSPLDTAGEKEYEEFVGAGEVAVETGMAALLAVPWLPVPADRLEACIAAAETATLSASGSLDKEQVVQWVSSVVAELRHRDSARHLDQRM
jgi:nucleoside-diphosphate-sugar epimerase